MRGCPLTHDRVFDDRDFADRYFKKHQKMAERFGREYAKKLMSLGFGKGRVLDVGCGFGGTIIYLAETFPDSEFAGIDLSEPLLQIAEQTASSAKLSERVRFEKADVQQIPYENDDFHVILNINMVHLVEDPVTMLNEIERVLIPNGLLFIADIRRSWIGIIEKEFKAGLTLSEAQKLFGKSNLRDGSFSSSFLWWRFEA